MKCCQTTQQPQKTAWKSGKNTGQVPLIFSLLFKEKNWEPGKDTGQIPLTFSLLF